MTTSLDDLVKIAPTTDDKAKVLSSFGFHNFTNQNFDEAFQQFFRVHALNGEVLALTNAVIISRDCKRDHSALGIEDRATNVAKGLPDTLEKASLYDALCHNAGNREEHDAAAKFGAESLRIKDVIAGPGIALTPRKRPVFDFYNREKNIIAFSLYGADPRYVNVAIENAKAVSHVYPGWTCRFYVDTSVPTESLDAMASHGAQIRILQHPHDRTTNSGLFWRFHVASDPDVDFFLCRDVDSLINVREKVAVDEWIASDKDFHVIRDFYTHSELILAGLWGGVGGRIPDIQADIAAYQKPLSATLKGARNVDQTYLRDRIWNAIKPSLMQHDSAFKRTDTRDFPSVGRMHPVRHVGQNMGVFLNL